MRSIDRLMLIVAAIPAVFLAGCRIPTAKTVFVKSFQEGHQPTAAYAGTQNASVRDLAPDSTWSTVSTEQFTSGRYNGQEFRGLLSFIITGQFPAEARVEKAILTFVVVDRIGAPVIDIYAADPTAWNGATVTWNTAPSTTGGVIGSFQGFTYPDIVDVEIDPSTVEGWIEDPNNNFDVMLVLRGTDDDNYVSFRSSTSVLTTLRPMLTIAYTL